MKVIQRWGQRPPRSVTPQHMTHGSILFVHYSASDGQGIDKQGEPTAAMRNIQNHHMDANGWSNIGYSYVVFQQRGIFKRPLIFKGRGFGAVPAAQEGSNTGNGAVCVIADSDDPIKRSTFKALAWIARRCPARRVRGHRDVNSTACPGDKLYSKVDELDRVARMSKRSFLP
jgi:hypothetical protein